jgi:hypothetical protein
MTGQQQTQLKWAHFGVAASQVIIAGAGAMNLIPGWGPIAGLVLGAAAHAVSGAVIGTVKKNVDSSFEG